MKICAIKPSQDSVLAQKTIINHENLRHQVVAKYVPRRRNQEKIMKICAIKPSQGSTLAQKIGASQKNLRCQVVAKYVPWRRKQE